MNDQPYILTLHQLVQRRRRQRALLRAALFFLGLGLGVLSLLILSGCSSSKMGKALNVGVGVAAASDFITTRQGIDSGRAVEANPFLDDFGPWGQGLIKVAGTSAVIGGAFVLERRGNPQVAHWVRVAFIVANVSVAVHNNGVGR